jgi:hypothetical protein
VSNEDNSIVEASAGVIDARASALPGPSPVEASAVCYWVVSNLASPTAPAYPDAALALGPVSLFPSAPAVDPNGLTMTYSAYGSLPAGLSVISATGEITGTLAYRGLSLSTARVAVTNGYLSVISAYFRLYDPVIVDTNRASAALLLPLYSLPSFDTLRLDDYSPTPKTITNANAVWSVANPNFYDGAAFFNGSASVSTSTSADFTFGTGAFTYEMWAYTTTTDATYKMLVHGNVYAVGPGNGLGLHLYGSEFRLFRGGAAPTNVLNVSGISANTWTHIALIRSNGLIFAYIQGVLRGAVADTSSLSDTAVTIGRYSGGSSPLTGGIQDLRIYKGLAKYDPSFTVPAVQYPDSVAGGDADFGSVAALLHGNGSNGSTIFTDNASAYTDMPAGYFDGVGDYLNYAAQVPLTLGSGDFTVETWVFFNALSPSVGSAFYDGRPSAGNGAYPLLYATSTTLRWYVSSADRINATVNWSLATWYHVAAVRSAGVTRLYVNGVQVGSTYTDATSYLGATNRPTIGGDGNNVTSNSNLNGYLRDFRITKGVARYTTSFTPPTSPLPSGPSSGSDPNFANVSLLLPMSSNFTDVSNNAFVATVNGNAKIATNAVPYGAAQISTVQSKFGGSSMSFNGTNSYVHLGRASDPLYNLGTGDFTIECWIYPTSISGNSANAGIYTAWGAAQTNAYLLYIQSANGGKITFYHQSVTSVVTSSAAASLNVWTHVAVCRSDGTTRMYVNGVLESVSTASYTLTAEATHPITLGAYWQAAAVEGTSYFNGYIDDLRVTKGLARYTANFTPPTQLLAP